MRKNTICVQCDSRVRQFILLNTKICPLEFIYLTFVKLIFDYSHVKRTYFYMHDEMNN